MRALLLCQRYFFSNFNSPTWKTISLDHWKSRNKTAINRAILLFTATSNNASRLAEVAENAGAPPSGGYFSTNYKLSRKENEPFDLGNGTCYIAIMAWLLKSGLVSYQWYLKNSSVLSIDGLKRSFGTPRQIWDTSRRFTLNDMLPTVPRGHIVHIYNSKLNTYGHWMVSLGNGLAAGCNNVTGGEAPVPYSANASLNDQFFHGFNQGDERGFQQGVAYVYDPLAIPNRNMLNVQY